jgi:hypothetical protein
LRHWNVRFRGEAGVDPQEKRAASVANDPRGSFPLVLDDPDGSYQLRKRTKRSAAQIRRMCWWRCCAFCRLKPSRTAWQNCEVIFHAGLDDGCSPLRFGGGFQVKAAIFLGLIGVAIGLLAILLSLGLLGSAPSSKPAENSWLGVVFGIAFLFAGISAIIPDYCRITRFVADLAPIAPHTPRSRHYHIPRHHVHVDRDWTGQESIHG